MIERRRLIGMAAAYGLAVRQAPQLSALKNYLGWHSYLTRPRSQI